MMDENINVGNKMIEYRNVFSPLSITDNTMADAHKIPLEIHRFIQCLLISISSFNY